MVVREKKPQLYKITILSVNKHSLIVLVTHVYIYLILINYINKLAQLSKSSFFNEA